MKIRPGEIPTTEELEFIKENRERVELVIRTRWILLVILAVYGIFVHVVFRNDSADAESLTLVHIVAPFAAVLFVALYNACFQAVYRWFVRIRSLNRMQLLFDMAVVTVMVHFSGGAVSWFWTMYLVLTLEASLIMDKKSDTYAIALCGTAALGCLFSLEFYGILSPVKMPFENNALQHSSAYGLIKWAWISITNFCVAFVAAFMMDSVRRRETVLREMAVRDGLTNLYNRRYFHYRLNSEVKRAKRYGRTLSLLLLDLDEFKMFNDAYGHLAGDSLLRSVAKILMSNIRRSDAHPPYEVDIACRYGGDEFAIILPEAASVQGKIAAERLRHTVEIQGAFSVAERIRRHVEMSREDGMNVTVSIGLASYPEHGSDRESLMRAADDAMFLAKRRGRNSVAVAGDDPGRPLPGGRKDG